MKSSSLLLSLYCLLPVAIVSGGRGPDIFSSPVSNEWHTWSLDGDELVVSARQVYPEWPRLKEASWEVVVKNPSLKPIEKDFQVASLIPKTEQDKMAKLYASNNVQSGRLAGRFSLDSLFSLKVDRGESVAFYFNASKPDGCN